MQWGTALERRIDQVADRMLRDAAAGGVRAGVIEFVVFVLKQAWACAFGAALLVVIVAARLFYPDVAPLTRNDFLTLAAIAIQILMLAFRLETVRELRVIILFHITGTVMELFKTDIGSWEYAAEGFLRIGGVPLFSGFMYAAVGSYMVRVYRLFDLRFERYPRRWLTAIVAAAIYINFFTHHFWWDARWVLFGAVLLLWGRTMMHARIRVQVLRLPQLAVFLGVAFFIWIAENVSTWAGAWAYPNQLDGWQMVSISKLGSWFLLMIISVVLVTWVYPPQRPATMSRDAIEAPPARQERPR